MARRISVDILCDVCQANDIESEAEEIEPTTIGRKGKPVILGLCKDHWEVYETFMTWLSEYGAPAEEFLTDMVQGPKTPPSPESCTVCGKEYRYTGSLREHLRKRHNMTLQEMRGEPAPPEEAPKVREAVCDVKGCEDPETGQPVTYTWPEYTRPAQALGLHKRQKHGIEGTARSTEKARTRSKAAKKTTALAS